MKVRIFLASAVLSLGLSGITLAQKPVEPAPGISNSPTLDKAKLRARAAKLRVVVDLLPLDHAADRDQILDLIMAARPEGMNAPGGAGMMGLMGPGGMDRLIMKAMTGDAEAAKGWEELEKESSRAIGKGAVDEAATHRILDAAEKRSDQASLAKIDKNRQEYAKKSALLAEKQLDLEEAERLHRKAD